MRWLASQVIPGAEFDSSERDPPPRCHPRTRLTLLNKILSWLCDPERETSILWLYGPAGIGKSAVIQTLTESENSSKTLGAALFFSRSNCNDNLKKALPAIAYQLAVRFPPYQEYIHEKMVADPRLLEKEMAEQFNTLIVEPFATRNIYTGQTLSIFLDGLDECQGEVAAQRKIIKLISAFVHEHPITPLSWVISSRPEPHLQAAFSSKSFSSICSRECIPVDSEEAREDVERYLRTEFENIRQYYPHSIPLAAEWPTEKQFLELSTAASGLFVLVAVIIRFIDDPDLGDPVGQLELVLATLGKLDSVATSENPLAALDAIYFQILSSIPTSALSTTKRILGHVLLQLQDRKTFGFVHTCNLLNLKQNVAYSALHKLHSVVRVPSPELAASTGLHIYHASFSDYLLNRRRSQKFWISLEEASKDVWGCYFRILQEASFGT